MKKILVVVDSINIEDSSGSKANVALIRNLIEAGFEVQVYHYTLKEIQLKNINCFAIPELKFNLLYFLSRTQRVLARNFGWNLMPFFEKRFGFSFTFFNDTNSIIKVLKKMQYQPDLVLTLSKGGSFRPHYAILKLPQFHDRWIAYVHDPYPFHLYPQPYNWVEPGYEIRENFFEKVSQNAKFSAFPSQLLKEWMGSHFPSFLKTGIVIPHQSSKYSIQNSNFPSYFDPSKFNLLHAGNMTEHRASKGLIEAFVLFLDKNPGARNESMLLFLGPASSDHTELIKKFQKEYPEILIENKRVPFDLTYFLQKNTTVNVILESKSEISPFLPAKFPHCVEANKTILSLAPFKSEVRRLLGDDYEYWSEVDDVNKIAFLIEKMYCLWKQNPEKLLLNRKDLEDYLSFRNLKISINNLIE